MIKFSEWFISAFKQLFREVGVTLKTFFISLYKLVIGNFISFMVDFFKSSKSFGASDWLAAIPAIFLIFILYAAIIVFIIQLIKSYIRFLRREHSKERLMHDIAGLNYKITELTDEKNALMALSGTKSLNIGKASNTPIKSSASLYGDSRFEKLLSIDDMYNHQILHTVMEEGIELTLKQLTKQFINFSASNLKLYYSEKTVSLFFAGMAASKSMILEGISGTGKTSLPYAMGKFFKNDAYLIFVQPSWRDRGEMIGYLNEFTKKYNETDFLAAIYEASYRTDLNFIILDEMNLARVEYYFADFLSLLEMPNPEDWYVDIVPSTLPSDPAKIERGKLKINQNIWFIGTANKDDSTFTITDKVYDRVSSIELNSRAETINAKPTEPITMSYDYLNSMFETAKKVFKLSDKAKESLERLDQYICDNFQITFGNRIMKQISMFIPVYVACGGDEIEGLDYLVARKVLRKFESLNLPFLQKELENLITFINRLFGKNNFNECRKMLTAYHRSI